MNESLEQPPAKTDKQLATEYLEYLKAECESVGESTDTTDCENPHLALALRYHHAHAKQRDELQLQLASARSVADTWHIRSEAHRTANEATEKALAAEREAREKAELALEQEKAWKNEDPRMLRQQIRVADVAFQALHERHQALLKEVERLREENKRKDCECGWSAAAEWEDKYNDSVQRHNDLIACAESAKAKLTLATDALNYFVSATAAQRAEAFLRVKGLWRESALKNPVDEPAPAA